MWDMYVRLCSCRGHRIVGDTCSTAGSRKYADLCISYHPQVVPISFSSIETSCTLGLLFTLQL